MKDWIKRLNSSRPLLFPLVLYVATLLSTFGVGYWIYGFKSVDLGLAYCVPLMTILTVHELGHYFFARRNGVESSFPFFIPIPFPPLGTFGAVIRLRGSFSNRRALFDIGAAGPVAGLVAALIFLVVGLKLSIISPCLVRGSAEPQAFAITDGFGTFSFGRPLVFQWLASLVLGKEANSVGLCLHPTAVAAWVGILLTTLNLFPVGQLDGGHVLYALVGARSKWFSRAFYAVGVVALLVFRAWQWVLFAIILAGIKLKHPPTLDDSKDVGLGRRVLGWALLSFIAIGFAPLPLDIFNSF